MRDYGLLLSLAALASVALWRPWLGVVGLTFVGYLQPHTYAGDLAHDFPVYKALFIATALGTLFTRDRQLPPRDWRVLALVGFWIGLFVSTYFAAFSFIVWPRLQQVSVVLASAFLTLTLINTRQKLFVLIGAIVASFALLTLKGGYWAVIHGFSDRVYGPPGSQYGDNNHFAVAAVMTIPLLALWMRQSRDRWLKGVLAVVIALSVLAALSSWSRGALLALAITLALMFADSRKSALALVPVAVAAGVAAAFLPEQWFERMETIRAYQTEGSAQGRMDAWRKGIEFALGSPWTGSGFEGWAFGAAPRDWHSAYVEILAEQGFVTFGLWLSLMLGTLLGLTRIVVQHRDVARSAWAADCSRALRASLLAYCAGAAFVGIGYWDLLFQLIAVSILLPRLSSEADGGEEEGGQRARFPAKASPGAELMDS